VNFRIEELKRIMVYTPGLIVKPCTNMEKVRRLPMKGEVLVKEGERVQADIVVARTLLPGGVLPLNVASMLGVEPKDLPRCMLKEEGDPVEGGEKIAATKGFLGLFPSSIISPGQGTLERISLITGQVILREPPRPVELNAYIDGEVARVLPEEGAIIRTRAACIQGIFGLGGEARGSIAMKVEHPGEVMDADAVGEEDSGKILVAGSLVSREAFARALEVGAAGVVTGGAHYQDLEEYLGRGKAVSITGAESLKATLVVTEGFGRIPMAQPTFDLISRFEGAMASLNGATQIRAGVVRPEVIISLTGAQAERADEDQEEAPVLKIGTWVRIIREPYFGVMGRVAGLPSKPLLMESEIKAGSVAVETQGSWLIEVPRSNVEIVGP
jgi:hypothetical protein